MIIIETFRGKRAIASGVNSDADIANVQPEQIETLLVDNKQPKPPQHCLLFVPFPPKHYSDRSQFKSIRTSP